jgi:hypothetical protein
MNVAAFILCLNEHEILKYTLRHYQTFCTHIILLDLGSTDGCQDFAKGEGCEVRQFDCKQEFDDRLNQRLKQDSWKGGDFDWVMQVDCDEICYFPQGALSTLTTYDLEELPVIKPHGFDMFSDVYPTTDQQIYDELPMGASEDFWGAKPILFSPRRVKKIEFGTGAHWCEATLTAGTKVTYLQKNPVFSDPPCYLLHYHHIGGLTRIARKYDATTRRLSQMNRRMNWGNQKPGIIHAQEKRDFILSRLQRVIS